MNVNTCWMREWEAGRGRRKVERGREGEQERKGEREREGRKEGE